MVFLAVGDMDLERYTPTKIEATPECRWTHSGYPQSTRSRPGQATLHLGQLLEGRFFDVRLRHVFTRLVFPRPVFAQRFFDPSLLAFQERQDDLSLKNLFRIDRIPSNTQMREILDVVEIDQLNECFADIFYELQRGELQRGGVLKDYVLFDGQYLLAPPNIYWLLMAPAISALQTFTAQAAWRKRARLAS